MEYETCEVSIEYSAVIIPATDRCSICLDHVPLVKLMNKCSHPAACRACLRELYINQAQRDVANYPLRCFDPSCDRIVREVHLTRHSLATTEGEISRHRRLIVLAGARTRRRAVAHCPSCDHPLVRRVKTGEYLATCAMCGERYTVENEHLLALGEVDRECLRALGVRTCRRCGSNIEHRGGCYKMKCRCGYRFCFVCGSENARCGCTPDDHGFLDNRTGNGDFAGLDDVTSPT